MHHRVRRFYRATLALHQRLSAFARDYPSDPKAQLYRDASEEMRLWAIHIDNDVRPLPPAPSLKELSDGLDFEEEVEAQEFREAARQFDANYQTEAEC